MKRRNRPTSSARSPQPRQESIAAARAIAPKDWLFIVALLAAVVLVYQPAWHGALLWDDDMHVTRPDLQSWHGLCRIWFDVGATLQYYPVLHSAFWIEHALWGDAPLGYHLVNVFLHATAALMVALVLRRLKIPGAYLAAAIFALHPVHVESVAWISEQKNTLSAVFYLGAALAYLRFDGNRRWGWYLAAIGLFLLAVLSKIVTVTLPAALLVVFWWQRGKLSWRRDVLPLLPFFAVSLIAGLFVTWVERKMIGAEGPDFALSLMDRCLLPGRVVWFYLAKLFWPTDLLFMYCRWQISPAVWWQFLIPLAALLVLLAALWAVRRRWRGPLAGMLFFIGALFPILGFLNVYWFVFSFVADHFQYLASLGIITLAAAGVALLLDRWGLSARPIACVLCLTLLAPLAALTWRQSRIYRDGETLYRTTLDANPRCWVLYNNLGLILAGRGQTDEAIACYNKALDLKPDDSVAHNNFGMVLANCGRLDEAIAHYQEAVAIEPRYAEAYNNLGLALASRGQIDEALAQYDKALKLRPDVVGTINNIGLALAGRGQIDQALAQYDKALRIKPDDDETLNNLGLALAKAGRLDEAIACYGKSLKAKPDSAEAYYNLGAALFGQGRVDEAIAHYRKALELQPDYARAYNNLGAVLAGRGEMEEAITHFNKAVELDPNNLNARENRDAAIAEREASRQSPSIRAHP